MAKTTKLKTQGKTIKIKQVRSGIGFDKKQKAVLKGLGFGKEPIQFSLVNSRFSTAIQLGSQAVDDIVNDRLNRSVAGRIGRHDGLGRISPAVILVEDPAALGHRAAGFVSAPIKTI